MNTLRQMGVKLVLYEMLCSSISNVLKEYLFTV